MSDVDLWWEVEPPGPAEPNVYNGLGQVLMGEWVGETAEGEFGVGSLDESIHRDLEIEDCEPLERVVRLVQAGDQHVLLDSDLNEARLYGLAVECGVDPHVQLELGCVLLQRANPDEYPLCEHLYPSKDFVDWDPHTEIHEELGPGPPSRERTQTIRLALRAYGNAWSYYKWGHAGSSHYLFRTLLALDGMRVCHSELDDHKSVWRLCSGLEPWLHDLRHRFGGDEEVDKFVAEVGKRFARTQGRLEPIMIGRSKALKALEREFAWWDMVPVDVRDYLADADYMRSTLKDPTYNPKGVVAAYCMAVEEMLQQRLGRLMDSYIDAASREEAESFKDEFLRYKKDDKTLKEWTCGSLILGRWAKYLRKPLFKSVLSKAGADAAFYFSELPRELWRLLEYRDPASHAHKRLFTNEGVLQLRTIVLELMGNLAQVRVILTSTQSNDG